MIPIYKKKPKRLNKLIKKFLMVGIHFFFSLIFNIIFFIIGEDPSIFAITSISHFFCFNFLKAYALKMRTSPLILCLIDNWQDFLKKYNTFSLFEEIAFNLTNDDCFPLKILWINLPSWIFHFKNILFLIFNFRFKISLKLSLVLACIFIWHFLLLDCFFRLP